MFQSFKSEPKVKPRYRSSIPKGVTERMVSPYRREGNAIWLREVECLLGGVVVGERHYDHDGAIQIETPLRDGKKHGVVYHWYDGGKRLASSEPYFKGLPHGTAKQWGEDGKLLGTYTMKHGTGVDLWRSLCEDGTIYLSEVYQMKGGRHHGYVWWLYDDKSSVWSESHWHEGQFHGIEREWNHHKRLKRGYPKYYFRGARVDKRSYLKACEIDPNLPVFQEEDNRPRRSFPPEIASALGPSQL